MSGGTWSRRIKCTLLFFLYEDTLLGKICGPCEKTHETVPAYKQLTLTQLVERLEDADETTEFEEWITGVVDGIRSGVTYFTARTLKKGSVEKLDIAFDTLKKQEERFQ